MKSDIDIAEIKMVTFLRHSVHVHNICKTRKMPYLSNWQNQRRESCRRVEDLIPSLLASFITYGVRQFHATVCL